MIFSSATALDVFSSLNLRLRCSSSICNNYNPVTYSQQHNSYLEWFYVVVSKNPHFNLLMNTSMTSNSALSLVPPDTHWHTHTYWLRENGWSGWYLLVEMKHLTDTGHNDIQLHDLHMSTTIYTISSYSSPIESSR